MKRFNQKIYAHGKLLITGEYFVLDGAKSLALPTQFGQDLKVSLGADHRFHWESQDKDGNIWFELQIDQDFNIINTTHTGVAKTLIKLLQFEGIDPKQFLGKRVTTRLGFDKDWGLGSSSTLIANMAQWLDVNPYALLEDSFGGSGYDLACAVADGPITYQIINGEPTSKKATFKPSFTDHLFFVYLNQKQNSRQSIDHYRSMDLSNKKTIAKEISNLTDQIIKSSELNDFIQLLQKHEDIIGDNLQMTKVQDIHFKDFDGVVKSLGGWGGDFVLAASTQDPTKIPTYFKQKGFDTVVPYKEMIL